VPVCVPCPAGRATSPRSAACDICAEGYFRMTKERPVSECAPCPHAIARCGLDTTVETMVLAEGWWRISNTSAEWHWCGDIPGRRLFELRTWLSQGSDLINLNASVVKAAVCRGGWFPLEGTADASCVDGHAGPLCQSCGQGFYLDEASYLCNECPTSDRIGGLIIIALVCVFSFALLRRVGGSCSFFKRMGKDNAKCGAFDVVSSVFDVAGQFVVFLLRQGTLIPTLKLLISFCQIVYAIPGAYDVSMPRVYYKWTDWLEEFSFAWLFTLGVDPLCVGGNVYSRLLFFCGAPLVVMVALPLAGVGLELFKRIAGAYGCIEHEPGVLANSLLQLLPLSLFVAFCTCVSVSKYIFAVWDCMDIEDNSLVVPPTSRSFMASDLAVECDILGNSEYARTRDLATVMFAIWPVGMPLIFLAILLPSRKALLKERLTRLTRATSFLHKDYEPEFFFWEPLALFYRLAISGFIHLVPSHLAFIRLNIGLITTILYSFLIMTLKPYESIVVDCLCMVTQLALMFIFLTSISLKLYDLTDFVGLATEVTGFESEDQIAYWSIGLIFGTLTIFFCVAAFEIASDEKKRSATLKLMSTRIPPRLSLRKNMMYHLFLSHTWSSAQDQAAVIKRRLQMVMPGAQIFLDVDDMMDTAGLDGYVNESQCILLLYSRGYYASAPCRNEIKFTLQYKKPLCVVHEEDVGRGGATLGAVRDEYNAFLGAEYGNRYDDLLFPKHGVIPFRRVGDHQTLMLCMIAEEMLRATPLHAETHGADAELFLPGSTYVEDLMLPDSTKIYVSKSNPGAIHLVSDLKEQMDTPPSERRQAVIAAAAAAEAAAAEAAAAAAAAAAAFDNLPCACTLVGLKSRAEINGQHGQAVEKDDESGCFRVILENGELLLVARNNLQPREHAPAAAESGAFAHPVTLGALGDTVGAVIGAVREMEFNVGAALVDTAVAGALATGSAGSIGLLSIAAVPAATPSSLQCVKRSQARSITRRASGVFIGQASNSSFTTNDPDALRPSGESAPTATHMLLYLNQSTFVGDEAAKLAEELAAALKANVRIVLAHEVDPARGGCEFAHFFATAPRELVSAGLFAPIAVACYEGTMRVASLGLLAKEFGAQEVDIKRLSTGAVSALKHEVVRDIHSANVVAAQTATKAASLRRHLSTGVSFVPSIAHSRFSIRRSSQATSMGGNGPPIITESTSSVSYVKESTTQEVEV